MLKFNGQGGMLAQASKMRAALDALTPDFLYLAKGSRVAHNMLLEWKVACSIRTRRCR